MFILGLIAFLAGCFGFALAGIHVVRERHKHSQPKSIATVAAFLLAGIGMWLFAIEIALMASGHYRAGTTLGGAAKIVGAVAIPALIWVVFAYMKRCPQIEDDTQDGR